MNVRCTLLAWMACGLLSAGPNQQVGPGPDPSGWPGTPQTKLGWNFLDPHNPVNANLLPGWTTMPSGTPPAWGFQQNLTYAGQPAQWYNTLPVPQSSDPNMPFVDTYIWFSFVYDYNINWTGAGSVFHRPHAIFSSIVGLHPDGSEANVGLVQSYTELYFDVNGRLINQQTQLTNVRYACFTQGLLVSNDSISAIGFNLGTDFFTQNGQTYYQGDIWQPYLQLLSTRQRLPLTTLRAQVTYSNQQQWVQTSGGVFTGVTTIAVSCSNFAASFYYTLDGSTPTSASPRPIVREGYNEIILTNSCTLRVMASLGSYAPSYASAVFSLTVPPPTFSPGYGTFFNPSYVNISCRDDQNNLFNPVALYYTSDGSDPTTASTPITNGQNVLVSVSGNPLKALATRTSWLSSSGRSEEYMLMVSNIVMNPSGGFFPGPTNILVSCATLGADIHYEKGLSPPSPTLASPVAINGSISISGSTVVRAKGMKNGWLDGPETVGYFIAGATYTYLGTLVPPAAGGRADAAHPPQLFSQGGGGGYITNMVINGGSTNYVVAWSNFVTRGVYLSYTNVVVSVNPGELEIDWWDGATGTVKSLYIIQAGPSPGTRAKKLYWNQPPSRGPLVDVTAVPQLTFFYNEDILAPTNTVSPETVWVASSGAKQHLYARAGMGYLVLLYEGAVTNGPLYGVDVVQVMPNTGWHENNVPVGAQLLPVVIVSNPAAPYVSAGNDSTPTLIYQHGVQGKMNGTVFAINQNTLMPLMEVFFQEIGGHGFNVNWPYEMDRYCAYWPEENDRHKPAHLYVRGDREDDIGPPFNIPAALNPELMTAERFADAADHGFLSTNAFMSSGPGRSLLKFSTDNGNGQPGSEWVGFETIKSIERATLLWQYRRLLRLQPPTPVANYQVRVVLSNTFAYAHCNPGGSDLRFYDAGGEELDYWIEQWNNAGVSIIWIEASDAQTATIYFEYGNTNTYPLSSAWDTFDLYDDFTEGLDQWNLLGAPLAQNGQLRLNPGDQLVARALVAPGSIIETWLAGALTPQANVRGALCGASSLYGLNALFQADLNSLISNPVQYADWDLGRNSGVAFAGQSCDSKYVQYGPSLASLASNDLLAVAFENGRITWFRNNVQQGSPVVQNTPSPPLFPLLNVYSSGGAQAVRISRVRMRKYSATPPAITIGAEQPALTIDWPIGVELRDDHQQGPGAGYLHVAEGNRYLPDLYAYGSSNSQLFGVNAGTLEVWWCSWMLTNRYAAGVQIPSFVRRYNNIWPSMNTNNALAYANAGGSVNCGTDPTLVPTNQLTLEAWVWPRAKSTLNSIIAKRTADTSASDGFALYINSRDTSDGRIVFETKNQLFSTPAGTITIGTWQHIAVTVAGTNATIYLNGIAAQASGGVNLTRDNTAPLLLGGCGGADGTLLGFLDDVRVWATVRTPAQIAQAVQQELPNPQDQSGLLAYYPCNEGSGTVAADVSGYGHAGTLYAVGWTNTAAPITSSSGNLGQIVVASSFGGRPFDGGWQNAYIYSQNSTNQPGYNPNEEHALMYSGLPFALRNDLNRQDATSPYTSQPFVLMPYQPPNSTRWHVQVYQVIATNAHYAFVYPTNYAARLLSPPDPLASWPGNQQTVIFSGPAWRDRNNHLWAAAAGNAGPNAQASIVLQWFYPYMDSSWYIPSWYASSLSNNVIPLLDRFAGTPGKPINTFYTISWEQNYLQLQVYDTLYKPRNGLPDMSLQTSADIVFQQAMVNTAFGTGPVVRLVDPTRVRSVALPANYALPANLVKETSFVQGHYYFNDLPPQLNQRLWYDATQKKLLFDGQYVPLTSSQSGLPGYLLFNVISPREKTTITNVFAGYGDATLLNAAVALCNLCSNVIEVTNDAIPFDTLALSAGTAKGTGYVTLAFNNSTNSMMQPPSDQIQLQVINVVLPAFDGELEQVGLQSNPYAEQANVRHSSDFNGDPSQFAFDWRFILPDNNGLIPANQTNVEQWSKYPYVSPSTGQGAVDITIAGDNLFALDSHYFVARYRRIQPGYPGGTN